MVDRDYLNLPSKGGPYEYDGNAEVVIHDDGLVLSVTQEQAVDSYNSTFTCSAKVSLETAAELHAWLGKALGFKNSP